MWACVQLGSEVGHLHKHAAVFGRWLSCISFYLVSFGRERQCSSSRCWWSWRTWQPGCWVTLCSGSTSTCCCQRWWCLALHWASGYLSTAFLHGKATSSTGETISFYSLLFNPSSIEKSTASVCMLLKTWMSNLWHWHLDTWAFRLLTESWHMKSWKVCIFLLKCQHCLMPPKSWWHQIKKWIYYCWCPHLW